MDLRSRILDLDPKISRKHQTYNPVITFSEAWLAAGCPLKMDVFGYKADENQK